MVAWQIIQWSQIECSFYGIHARLHVTVSQLGPRSKLERGEEGFGVASSELVVDVPFALLEYRVECFVSNLLLEAREYIHSTDP